MSKVSVLVAVYNSADTLDRCVNSLLSQSHTDLQVICVDDASTDSSLSLLRHYASVDKRIEVIALEQNMGQAHARNEALKKATGDYITFLDSDDWFAPDAIEQAVATFAKDETTDCVLFNAVYVYPPQGNTTVYPVAFNTAITGREAFVASLTWSLHGLYMLRADIHHRYPYDESCRAYSDDNTTRLHYLMSRKVDFCSGTYYYYQNSKSITHAVSMLRFEHIKANESMKRQLQALHVDTSIMSLYETQRWLVLIDTYMFYFHSRLRFSPEQRHTALTEMQRVWQGIEYDLVDRKIKRKFGYRPCHRSWSLFRLQEEAYFLLRDYIIRPLRHQRH